MGDALESNQQQNLQSEIEAKRMMQKLLGQQQMDDALLSQNLQRAMQSKGVKQQPDKGKVSGEFNPNAVS